MGQIAEDMIDGTCCALCGQYFRDKNDHLYTHDRPAACLDCWEEGCGYEKPDKGIETY